jgi:peptide/nickel transport system substrate-binding protein
VRSNGPKAWFRWPDFPPVLSLIDAWAEAQDVPSQQKIAAEIQAKALDPVPYSDRAVFHRAACRNDIIGIIPGQFVFWNVRRT